MPDQPDATGVWTYTYTLYRCTHVVSKGPKEGMRCYRPTVPSHGKNHWLEEKMMVCPEEDHCCWQDDMCMMCGKVVR